MQKKREFAYIWNNGCYGKMIQHSVLWGLFEWTTYEVIDCPPGVSPPDYATPIGNLED